MIGGPLGCRPTHLPPKSSCPQPAQLRATDRLIVSPVVETLVYSKVPISVSPLGPEVGPTYARAKECGTTTHPSTFHSTGYAHGNVHPTSSSLHFIALASHSVLSILPLCQNTNVLSTRMHRRTQYRFRVWVTTQHMFHTHNNTCSTHTCTHTHTHVRRCASGWMRCATSGTSDRSSPATSPRPSRPGPPSCAPLFPSPSTRATRSCRRSRRVFECMCVHACMGFRRIGRA
jgi:hypothetical protein